jgi:hypothetical protein
MADAFERNSLAPSGPATDAEAVTPNDGADITDVSRGLYVGTTGNVKVTMSSGDVVTFNSMAAGIIHPIRVKRVWSTGTTAGNIVAVY